MKTKLLFSIAGLFVSHLCLAQSVFPVSAVSGSFENAAQCTPHPTVSTDTGSDFCTLFPETVASCWPLGHQSTFTPEQMKINYTLMLAPYGGSLFMACKQNASKNGSTTQQCIDQWTCYIKGGKDSQGGLCSGTGVSCE